MAGRMLPWRVLGYDDSTYRNHRVEVVPLRARRVRDDGCLLVAERNSPRTHTVGDSRTARMVIG